jgi:LPXTG-site transpeptidase (sortase) family protein
VRSLLRPAILIVGGLGLMVGLVLVAAGVYYSINSNDSQASRLLTLERISDPGGIYDLEPNIQALPSPNAPAPPLKDSPFRLLIPKINVDAGVVTEGVDANQIPKVPLNGYDVAWYNFSAKPGTGSNAVFAGHVTWNGPAVFYNLDSMAVGDDIILHGQDGTEVRYKVSETYLVNPNDPASVGVMAPTPTDMVTIITCGGTFYYTGDPVFGGDYTDRRIVRAALTGVVRPPVAAAAGG